MKSMLVLVLVGFSFSSFAHDHKSKKSAADCNQAHKTMEAPEREVSSSMPHTPKWAPQVGLSDDAQSMYYANPHASKY